LNRHNIPIRDSTEGAALAISQLPPEWHEQKGKKISEIHWEKRALPDQEIVNRYLAEESANSIACSLGIGRSTVERRLIALNIPLRTNAEANRIMIKNTPIEILRSRIKVAQESSRGRTITMKEKIARAATRQARATHQSAAEILLATWLEERGISVIPQQAVGPYNVDIGAFPVAVEIFGGGWHFVRDHSKRFRYIFDQGWHLIIIYVDGRRSVLTPGAADYIVSFFEEATRNPSIDREYRMIWGEGKAYAAGGSDSDELASIIPHRGSHGRRPRDDSPCRKTPAVRMII